tara:strand:- start:3153 stop:3545 length:393 start_codon:yes stop_codon:yes gene_type:complete
MDMNNCFPSKWLKASDLQGQAMTYAMQHVQMEEVGSGQKPVLYFQGQQKGLVLNKVNTNSISSIYGPESNNWQGQQITLFPSVTDYQGASVDCIRVKPVAPIQMQPSAQAQPQQDGRPTPPDDTYVPVDA